MGMICAARCGLGFISHFQRSVLAEFANGNTAELTAITAAIEAVIKRFSFIKSSYIK